MKLPALSVGCALLLTACATTGDHGGRHHDHYKAGDHPPVMMSHLHALDQPDNDARRDALVAMLRTHGFEPDTIEFDNPLPPEKGDPRRKGTNITFTVGEGEKEIIIGAHYDAVRLADGTMSQGMVDNGASVIALAHVAEELRAHGGSDHRVRFVFFDMEEIGLVGAFAYARTLDPESVLAMINLDVNAYGRTVFYGATRNGYAPLYEAMRAACNDLDQACIDFPSYPPSDYIAFERAGIPNISLSVLPRMEAYQLWLAMNAGDRAGFAPDFVPEVMRTIHSSGDTFEAVQAESIVIAVDTVLGLLHHLDHVDGPLRPAEPAVPEPVAPLVYD